MTRKALELLADPTPGQANGKAGFFLREERPGNARSGAAAE